MLISLAFQGTTISSKVQLW